MRHPCNTSTCPVIPHDIRFTETSLGMSVFDNRRCIAIATPKMRSSLWLIRLQSGACWLDDRAGIPLSPLTGQNDVSAATRIAPRRDRSYLSVKTRLEARSVLKSLLSTGISRRR